MAFLIVTFNVCKMETLRKAYGLAKANNGAPGIDA